MPGWFGDLNQGGGIAIGDVDSDGQPDLVVFHVDNPTGADRANHGYYRVGFALSARGDVTGGWGTLQAVPGWFGDETAGADIALANLNGNAWPDLIVFHIDQAAGPNYGYYRVGLDFPIGK